MQPTTCKYLLLSVVFILLMPQTLPAQFIRMNIRIPAGLDLNIDASEPKLLEAPRGLAGANAAMGTVRWMELRARENTALVVHLRLDAPLSQATDSLLWLNNGTNNFSEALAMPFRCESRHFKGFSTMKQMPSTYTHFSAWLGIPGRAAGVLTIEYH